MIIGVDLGNYSVKTSERINFLSKITQEENFKEENKFIYNGTTYFIGEGEFSTEWIKSKKESTLPLLYIAIYKSTRQQVNDVVIGLPIQQYKNNKAELIKLIKNNRFGEVNGREIIIDNVEVAPEGASAYYNISKDIRKEIGTHQLIIIDVGGRTTDITVFKNYKIVDIKTIAVGALNVYQDIVNHINTTYTESYLLEDGETVMNEGLLIDGEKKDVSFVTGILKKYFNSIYKELQLKYDLRKGYVYLTGGGSKMFKLAFQNRLKNLLISNEPIYDNVFGFEKVGEQLWQGK